MNGEKGNRAPKNRALLAYIERAARTVAPSAPDFPAAVGEIAARKLLVFYRRRGRLLGLAEQYHDISDWRALRERLQQSAERDRRLHRRDFARDALEALNAAEPPMPEAAEEFARNWQRHARRRYVDSPTPVEVCLRLSGPGKYNRRSGVIASFQTAEAARDFASRQPPERLRRWASVCWPRHQKYLNAVAEMGDRQNFFVLVLHHDWLLPRIGEEVAFSRPRDHRKLHVAVAAVMPPKEVIKGRGRHAPGRLEQEHRQHQQRQRAPIGGDAYREVITRHHTGEALRQIQKRALDAKRARERRADRRRFIADLAARGNLSTYETPG